MRPWRSSWTFWLSPKNWYLPGIPPSTRKCLQRCADDTDTVYPQIRSLTRIRNVPVGLPSSSCSAWLRVRIPGKENLQRIKVPYQCFSQQWYTGSWHIQAVVWSRYRLCVLTKVNSDVSAVESPADRSAYCSAHMYLSCYATWVANLRRVAYHETKGRFFHSCCTQPFSAIPHPWTTGLLRSC